MPNAPVVAIVEDEQNIRELLSFNLQAAGYATAAFETGEDALTAMQAAPPALVLLDLMLPGIDGLEVCRRMRAADATRHIPVVMLTARGEEIDRVLGLEIGADDYITKPFSMREVLARVKAVLRRAGPPQDDRDGSVLAVGSLMMDAGRRVVMKDGVELQMPMKEFDLLRILLENRGRVLTREQLLDRVWGYDFIGETRTVDVHVRHLRMKVEDDPDNPALIETVRGVGYRITAK